MIEAIINECMTLDLEAELIKKSEPKKKKTKTLHKQAREQKINQQYKQSINPSKRHRDRLNSELDNLAKLLPFSEDIIARLDKLSILRLSVSYLRNKNFFKTSQAQQKAKVVKDVSKAINRDNQFAYLFNEAIEGFILVITLNGEIFFVSESVKDHLGYSQSQVLHQPLETLVHDDDREDLLSHLKGPTAKIEELKEGEDQDNFSSDDLSGQSRDFVIRLKSVMNTSSSDMYKPYRVSGTIRALNIEPEVESLKHALFAFCTPARTSHSMLEIRMKTTLFCSKNRIDLSFLDLDARGKEFFGYSKKDIFGRSSYVLVHRFDLRHLRCKHTEIMTCGKSSIATFRLMTKNHEWSWVCGFARVVYKNGKPDYVVTTNRMMSEKEGQAMLKFRDEVDYKALAQLGLIEPEDPAKAIELGFPEHPSSKSLDLHTADSQPIPMMLGDLIGADLPGSLMNQPTVQPKTENVELLKSSPLFDVDVHDQRGYWTGENSFMNQPGPSSYPSCEVTSDNFQPTMGGCHSPTGSNISGQTHHGSTHSNSSTGVNETINFESKPEAFHNMSPSYPTSFQQQLHHSQTPLKAIHSDGSTPSCSATRPPTQATPQLAHMPETSLFDDLTNLDMVQQQMQNSHQSRAQQSMRYPYVPNPGQATNDYYRQSKMQGAGQYASTDYNCLRSQSNSFENRVRTECNPFENRTSMYDQLGANVNVSSPGYGLSTDASLHTGFEYNAQRGGQMNSSSRPYSGGYSSSFIDNRNVSQSSSRTQGGLHAHQNMFNYNFPENSPLSPPQSFLPGGAPYTSWTQM